MLAVIFFLTFTMIRSSLIWHYLVDNTHTRLIFLIIYERLNDIEDRINSSFCDWCCVKKITQLQGDKRKGQNKHYGQVNKTNKTNRKIIPASQKLLIRVEFKWVLQEKQRWIIICVHVIQLALQLFSFVLVFWWQCVPILFENTFKLFQWTKLPAWDFYSYTVWI